MNQNRIPGWLGKSIWVIVLLLLFLAYFPLNSPREHIHSLETTVDDWIPLLPVFVFPYLSLYALLAISLWRFLKAETRIFSITALAISLDLVLSYLVFFFYQTQVERPVILGDGSIQWTNHSMPFPVYILPYPRYLCCCGGRQVLAFSQS